jgi:hypothetical protein
VHVIPQVTFGIVFDNKNIPNSAIDFGVDCYATMHGSLGSSTEEAWNYCYGVKGGVDVFARVTAPTVFGMSLNNYWSLYDTQVDVVPEVCKRANDYKDGEDRTVDTWDKVEDDIP